MRSTIEEAACWHTRLSSGLADAERREFEGWVAEPGNAREFNACRYLLDVAIELKGHQRAELLASIADVKPARAWLAGLRE